MTPDAAMTMSLEDYLEGVYMLILEKKPARVRDIAASLGVKTPSVVYGIAALKRLGYVSQEPYGSVEITPAGLQHAKDILRKHKMLTTFFTFIGSSAEAAEADACKFEHVISHETLVAIERFLASNKVKVGVGRPFRPRK